MVADADERQAITTAFLLGLTDEELRVLHARLALAARRRALQQQGEALSAERRQLLAEGAQLDRRAATGGAVSDAFLTGTAIRTLLPPPTITVPAPRNCITMSLNLVGMANTSCY
jgi:hypothetical protein